MIEHDANSFNLVAAKLFLSLEYAVIIWTASTLCLDMDRTRRQDAQLVCCKLATMGKKARMILAKLQILLQ